MNAKVTSRSAHCSDRCIRALANYTPRRQNVKYAREMCAAVLVALFVGRKGDLYVLLSRCAGHRIKPSHPVTTLQAGIHLTHICR